MEHARLSSLLVIALLQLSQTEISSTLPESWYAANVINDRAYAPKPLSEIFSTQATFSSTNPIVVLPTSQTTPTTFFTTAPPSTPISTSTTGTTLVSSTVTPTTEVSVVPLSTEAPPQPVISISTLPTPSTTILQSTRLTQTPQPAQPPQPPQIPQLPQLPQFQQPPAPPSPPPILSSPQQVQIQTAPQGSPAPPQIQSQPPTPQIQNQPPNYFLLYQQAPQNIQNYPPGLPLSSSTSFPTVTSSTLPPTTSLPPRPTTTAAPAGLPCNTSSTPQGNPQLPSFRIRMVAPVGSVTNVRISANPSTTTTTRRPTTTRTRRRNRNTYDGCISGCGGTRVPICASLLGVRPIDPDSLKGFPSVCHMACHNSFRRNLYEKVLDGKCGRLRTRIRPVNSNNKLNRDDLNKASYTIVQGGPAVIEFSPAQS